MQISYSPRFARHYRKLPLSEKLEIEEREEIFRHNPFDPRLKTHKLHGGYRGYWSFSVSRSKRIMFELVGQNKVIFINIGDHDIYK